MTIVISLILAFSIGYMTNTFITYIMNVIKVNKNTKDINNQFRILLQSIINKKSKFKTRVNNAVYIKTKLSDYGQVDIIYLLDKKDILLYKDNKCLFTTELVEKGLVMDIIGSIEKLHGRDINDVVEILGVSFYRKDIEKSMNMTFEDLKICNQESTNEKDLNIDDILDKINKVGLKNLSKEEIDFLNNIK